MILTFARPSVGAQVGSHVLAFGFSPEGNAPTPPAPETGFSHEPYLLVSPNRLFTRFGFMPVGQSAVVVTPSAGGGAGRPRKSPERRNLYQHRPNYDAVAEAYREAEERARELEAKKRKKALDALKIAEDAIEEARESRSQVNLAQLTGALEATARARAVLDIVEQARRSADIARLLMEEMQNEEEAEMLLLTH